MTGLAGAIDELQKRLTDYNVKCDGGMPVEIAASELADAAQLVLDCSQPSRSEKEPHGRGQFAQAMERLADAVQQFNLTGDLNTDPRDSEAAVDGLAGTAGATVAVVAGLVQAESVQTMLPYGIFLPHKLLDQMLGGHVEGEDLEALARAIPHSSIPDALKEILAGVRERREAAG